MVAGDYHSHQHSIMYLYQAQVPMLTDLPSKVVFDSRKPRVLGCSLAPSLGTCAWRGKAPPWASTPGRPQVAKGNLEGGQADPPQNPQELQTAWSAHFRKSMDFQKRPATKVWRALPRSRQGDAEAHAKFLVDALILS